MPNTIGSNANTLVTRLNAMNVSLPTTGSPGVVNAVESANGSVSKLMVAAFALVLKVENQSATRGIKCRIHTSLESVCSVEGAHGPNAGADRSRGPRRAV